VTHLLDGNLLVALASPSHVHHDAAHHWWDARDDRSFATCPITQGTLLRLALREGTTAMRAAEVLAAVTALPHHEFWADDMSYLDVDLAPVVGHRQVTDAYLAALARRRAGVLATFDAGLAAAHQDVCVLVPAS
jgi:toxin-antitoxin system PIN domain toxin